MCNWKEYEAKNTVKDIGMLAIGPKAKSVYAH